MSEWQRLGSKWIPKIPKTIYQDDGMGACIVNSLQLIFFEGKLFKFKEHQWANV